MLRSVSALCLLGAAALGLSLAPGSVPQESSLATEIQAKGETMRAIVSESLARGQAYDRLVDLCTTTPHRLSGSPGAAAAVEWARQELSALPFDDVRLEPVTVRHWVRGDIERVRVTAPPHLAGESFRCLALGGSVGTPVGGVSGEVLRVESFDELAGRADDARGRIVFFDIPMDPEARDTFAAYGAAVTQRVRGAIEAGKAGAVGVVIRSVASVIDDEPHTGGMRYQPGVPELPAAALSTVGAQRLTALLQTGPVTLNLELDCRELEPKPSFNVVADYLGSELPEEIVLVGGHLDGWDVGQGAHDDGAGTCHSIEVVSLLAELGLRPKRTIRVVLFMNEENGLAGARAYASDHADELDRHVLALESDAGGFSPRGFTTNAGEEGFAILRLLCDELVAERGSELDPGGGGADISQLAPAGVPLVGFRPDDERYFAIHHTNADTLEAVNQREMNAGAGVIAAMVWAVADLSVRMPSNFDPSR